MGAGSGQGDMQWRTRDRDIDNHAMQSKIGYLLSEFWKGRERRRREREKKERERERGKGKGEVRRGRRQKLPLREGDEKERSACLRGQGRECVWLIS